MGESSLILGIHFWGREFKLSKAVDKFFPISESQIIGRDKSFSHTGDISRSVSLMLSVNQSDVVIQ